MILALDQSLKSTGWVIMNLKEEVLAFGVIYTDKWKDDKNIEKEEDRVFYIIKEIEKLIQKFNISILFLENLSLKNENSRSARVLGGIYYAIYVLAKQNDIELIESFRPTTVKAFAGGGRYQKEDMFNVLPTEFQKQISEKYTKTKGLYDICDAYWIAKCGVNKAKNSK